MGSAARGGYAQLDQSLILRPEDDEEGSSNPAPAQPMIQVTAPTTLPEGYKLDVQLGAGRTYTVLIPPGGVEGGQTFRVPLPSRGGNSGDDVEDLSSAVARVSVPVGQWRDCICCCFSQGIIHPVLCNAIFCHAVAIAQIMVRLRLNVFGSRIEMRHGAKEAAKMTFWIILGIVVGEILLYNVIRPIIVLFNVHEEFLEEYDPVLGRYVVTEKLVPNEGSENIVYAAEMMGKWVSRALLLACIFWSIRTRVHIRKTYGIPLQYLRSRSSAPLGSDPSETQSCHAEDCLCATFCFCCSVSQMARHTMEFDTYPATCCTPTGVRRNAPDLIV